MTRGLAAGALSGAVGAAAMAAGSKLEQLATGRPDSFVPARTLAQLLRLPDPDRDGWARNMAMHYLAGVTAGTLRGVMSASNLRGPFASLMHTNIRLAFDQTLENAHRRRRATMDLAARRTRDRRLTQVALRIRHRSAVGCARRAVADQLGTAARAGPAREGLRVTE